MGKFFQRFTQFISVVLIALGVGLFYGAGKYHDYIMPESNPFGTVNQIGQTALAASNSKFSRQVPIDDDELEARLLVTTGCYGGGLGLLTLGLLGLLVPWGNRIRFADVNDNGSKAIGVLATSFVLATVLVLGVFRVPWSHWGPLIATFLIVCTIATIWIAMIFGWRPWLRSNKNSTIPETMEADNLIGLDH